MLVWRENIKTEGRTFFNIIKHMTRLEHELKLATTPADIYRLLQVCDIIHSTGKPYDGYELNDLPPDDVYEYYAAKINYTPDTSITKSTILYMSTIRKDKVIQQVKNAIVLPKYDGVSVAVKFSVNTGFTDTDGLTFKPTYANTRGNKTGTAIVNSNITGHIQALIDHIQIPMSIYSLMKDVKSVLNVIVRGELVNNYKCLDNSGNPTNCPAALVSGLLQREFKQYLADIGTLCMQYYEIGYIDYVNTNGQLSRYVPTQREATDVLTKSYIHYHQYESSYATNPQCALDTKVWMLDNTLGCNFKQMYYEIISKIDCPTDGLVYCSQDWRYPQREEQFNKKNYGKYAWKITSYHYARVEKIEWPITKNGELNPIVHFTPFTFGGRTFSSCKMTVGQMLAYHQQGFGIGAELSIDIAGGIIAHIDCVVNGVDVVYDLPTTCPYCSAQLQLIDGKTKKADESIQHLTCTNPACVEQKIQKYVFLIRSVSKHCPNLTVMKNGRAASVGMGEKTLRAIYEKHQALTRDVVLQYVPNLVEMLDQLNVVDQLCALSVGGEAYVKQLVKSSNIQSWRDCEFEWFA